MSASSIPTPSIHPVPDRPLILRPDSEALIDAYLDDYEMRGEDTHGRDACHTPTDDERALLKDAFMGFDFASLFQSPRHGPQEPGTAPAGSPALPYPPPTGEHMGSAGAVDQYPAAYADSQTPTHTIEIAGVDPTEGDKQLLNLLVQALGARHQAVTDLVSLIMLARSKAAAVTPAALARVTSPHHGAALQTPPAA